MPEVQSTSPTDRPPATTSDVSVAGVSVVVPTFNECDGVADVIVALTAMLDDLGRPSEVIVVDDGSTDGSGEVAREAGARVIAHPGNLGYGASLKTGIRRARHDMILICDADGTYPVDAVPAMLAAMENADMVVGARTGERVRIPLVRKPMKWFLRRLATFLARVEIPDLNSGLRCFRKSTVEEYMHLFPNGFSFTTTITLAYHCDSRLVHYLPIDYEKRTGSSKIRPLRDSYNFLLLVLRTVMYFDPMRVFMPPALVSLGITVLTLGYEALWSRNLAEKSMLWLIVTVLLFGLALLGDLVTRRRG